MEKIKHLVIRADASTEIGVGHVMRMIALAQAWQDRGGAVSLVSAKCPAPLADRLARENIGFRRLDVPIGSQQDIEQTCDFSRSLSAEWVVLDGYQFGRLFQRELRNRGYKVFAVDDCGQLDQWSADLILNQNPFAAELDYPSDAAGVRILRGSRFVLQRREFWNRRAEDKASWPLESILVSLGGGDESNITLRILRAFEAAAERLLRITVVAGVANPHSSSLQSFATSSRHGVSILANVDNMAELMRSHDGVVTAGGSTCFEWMCMERPAAVVVIAENQREIAASLVEEQFAYELGDGNSVSDKDLEDRLKDFVEGNWSYRRADPLVQVDGRGARRVAAALSGRLKITIVTASEGWLRAMLDGCVQRLEAAGHLVSIALSVDEVEQGDLLFLLSCWEIVPEEIRSLYLHTLVVHGSALPEGRGWSPVTWQILEGENEIPVCLLEAVEKVDAGPIYDVEFMRLDGTELLDGIRKEQAEVSFRMVEKFVNEFPVSVATPAVQVGEPSFYPRRSAKDSKLDVGKSLLSQFPLLRVVDNEAYPAFFDHLGSRYKLSVSRLDAEHGEGED